ncbi:hypothetical protein M0802_010656 [Mischocyttarus mexicanus]|nr:hypothetical protein M0802_010656 [Mischocyttarus mexicanus]
MDQTISNDTSALLMRQQEEIPVSQIEAVHPCKLSSFWWSTPETWFLLVSAFVCHQIKSNIIKYHLALATIDCNTIQDLFDVVNRNGKVPDTNKYEYLKTRLL